jgi:hypothetical protein
MRKVPVVLLAVCLVLSGCSFLGGTGTPTAGPNPGPGTATGTPADGQVDPPGIENGRLSDLNVLLDAHEAALLETGFEADLRANATNSFEGEVYESRQRQQTIVEPDATEYRFRTTSVGDGFVANNWGNESTTVVRARIGNTTRYQIDDATAERLLTTRPVLENYLNATEMTVVERGTIRDDRQVVRLANEGTPDVDELDRGVVPRNATDLRNWTVTAVVDDRGRVLQFRATAEYTLQEQDGKLDIRFSVLRTDEPSVERPEWVAEALERAAEQS